jgi:hypothetical protein
MESREDFKRTQIEETFQADRAKDDKNLLKVLENYDSTNLLPISFLTPSLTQT